VSVQIRITSSSLAYFVTTAPGGRAASLLTAESEAGFRKREIKLNSTSSKTPIIV
jgi:hypothetical protein